VLREFVVIRKAYDVVAERFIYVIDAIGAIFTLIHNTIDTSVRMEVCTFPAVRGIEVVVWIKDVGAREWTRFGKVVYGAKVCSNHHSDN
jgi:hypothetical protein